MHNKEKQFKKEKVGGCLKPARYQKVLGEGTHVMVQVVTLTVELQYSTMNL